MELGALVGHALALGTFGVVGSAMMNTKGFESELGKCCVLRRFFF